MDGSHFLQSFATLLKRHYLHRDLETIYLMVIRHMSQVTQVCVIPEEFDAFLSLGLEIFKRKDKLIKVKIPVNKKVFQSKVNRPFVNRYI